MAKKRTSKKSATDSKRPAKVVTQLRIKEDVHAKLTEQAKEIGTSLNELVEGILGAVAERMVCGEPERQSDGSIRALPLPGCMFVGFERETVEVEDEEHGTGHRVTDKGEVWFILDFSGRVHRYMERKG